VDSGPPPRRVRKARLRRTRTLAGGKITPCCRFPPVGPPAVIPARANSTARRKNRDDSGEHDGGIRGFTTWTECRCRSPSRDCQDRPLLGIRLLIKRGSDGHPASWMIPRLPVKMPLCGIATISGSAPQAVHLKGPLTLPWSPLTALAPRADQPLVPIQKPGCRRLTARPSP
jgi:hypothetical protein